MADVIQTITELRVVGIVAGLLVIGALITFYIESRR